MGAVALPSVLADATRRTCSGYAASLVHAGACLVVTASACLTRRVVRGTVLRCLAWRLLLCCCRLLLHAAALFTTARSCLVDTYMYM